MNFKLNATIVRHLAAVLQSAPYMGIIVFSRHFLQVQQGLVYTFLQLQATLQSLPAAPPLISIRFLRWT